MSAPSKIAAIRHAVSALHGAADDGADTRRYAEALQDAGEGIDDAIEALKYAREWIAEVGDRKGIPNGGTLLRIEVALARVRGAS